MAIYHCSIKIISRGKGKSAVAASAYRSGETITNEYDGVTHDFTRKGGIVHTEIMLPPHAPPDFADRSVLWNSVEKIEKSKNSQLAREIEVALPIELDREKQIQLVRDYVQENFVSVGMCADIAIHDKEDGNPHAHIMLTMRPLEQSGEWGAKSKKEYILDKDGQRITLKNGTFKTRKIDTVDWNNKEKAEVWRQAWADCTNKYLAEQNIVERVDHRSYERQGIEQIPTVHVGVSATQMERRGIVTEKGNKNRLIKDQNRLLKELKRRLSILGKWIKELNQKREEENQSINHINPIHSVPDHSPTLLEMLTAAMQQSNQPNSRYGKIRDLKTFAKAVSFLQENNITTLSELQESISEMRKRYQNTNGKIKQTEKQIHEREELIEQSENYLQYRDYHKAYKQTKPKKQEDYAERYRMELALYDRAERYLKEHLGSDTTLKLKAWKAEVVALTNEKDRLYREVRKLREKVSETETIKRCIEQAIEPQEQRKEQTKSKNMTL